MNPVLQILIDALLKYVKTHPEEVEKIIEMIVKAVLKHFEDNPLVNLPK